MSEHVEHGPAHYVKIYLILLVLFLISLIGPEIGIRWLTIITAFGIAIVKALLVASHFMQLNIEKKLIWYVLLTMLLACGLYYAGVSPDIMRHEGRNWKNVASIKLIEEHKNYKAEVEKEKAREEAGEEVNESDL